MGREFTAGNATNTSTYCSNLNTLVKTDCWCDFSEELRDRLLLSSTSCINLSPRPCGDSVYQGVYVDGNLIIETSLIFSGCQAKLDTYSATYNVNQWDSFYDEAGVRQIEVAIGGLLSGNVYFIGNMSTDLEMMFGAMNSISSPGEFVQINFTFVSGPLLPEPCNGRGFCRFSAVKAEYQCSCDVNFGGKECTYSVFDAHDVYVNPVEGGTGLRPSVDDPDGTHSKPYPDVKTALEQSDESNIRSILLFPGIYKGLGNRNINLSPANSIFFKSTGGTSSTIFDCEQSARGVVFRLYESAFEVTFEGLTIQNCITWSADSGESYSGPINLLSVEVTLRNCVIQHCQGGRGGAVTFTASTLKVYNSRFHNNSVVESALDGGSTISGYGGAFWLDSSNLMMQDSTCSNNRAYFYGGCIRAVGDPASELTFIRVNFEANTAVFYGGAMAIATQRVVVQDVVFAHNVVLTRFESRSSRYVVGERRLIEADGSGGAVFFSNAVQATFFNVAFLANGAFSAGGGLYLDSECQVDFKQVLMSENWATYHGGALRVSSAIASLNEVRLLGSMAELGEGGAISCVSGFVELRGKVLFELNTAPAGAAISIDECTVDAPEDAAPVFAFNTAEEQGGAVVIRKKGAMTIQGAALFESNHARLEGGALHIDKFGEVFLHGALLHNNSAGAGGAAYAAGFLKFLHCNISANRAGTDGGAVYLHFPVNTSTLHLNLT
eukprot:gene23237-28122_t